MMLELTAEEARTLRQAIDSQLLALMQELVHADQRHAREVLRANYERLDVIRSRLGQAEQAEVPQAHSPQARI